MKMNEKIINKNDILVSNSAIESNEYVVSKKSAPVKPVIKENNLALCNSYYPLSKNELNKAITQQNESLLQIAAPKITDWSGVTTGFFSVIIASIALYHTFREAKERKRESKESEIRREKEAADNVKAQELAIAHQKLLVKPVLILEADFALHEYKLKLMLKNQGVGPAIIKNLKIAINGQFVYGDNPIYEAINRLLPSATFDYNSRTFFGAEGSAIRPGESIVLYDIDFNFDVESSLSKEDKMLYVAEAKNELLKLGVSVSYESIYGETFTDGFM